MQSLHRTPVLESLQTLPAVQPLSPLPPRPHAYAVGPALARRGPQEPARRHPSPYDVEWVQEVLAELALRAVGGEPEDRLHTELLEALWPWAARVAVRLARSLPPAADRDALLSEVFWELYQSVLRIDWTRFEVWPALLRARLRGAVSTVARSEDCLTRGQRQARKAFLQTHEEQVQHLGRDLTPLESRDLAAKFCPRGGLTAVLYGTSRLSLDTVPAERPDEGGGPEQIALWNEAAGAVGAWIDHDLPSDLARVVRRWYDDPATRLSPGVRSRLMPFVPALMRRLQ